MNTRRRWLTCRLGGNDRSPEPGLEAQVRRAFQNPEAVLAAAGCSFDDVVDVTVFIVDPENSRSR